ncbi:transient receptor potential cation channel subfamily V member 5-like isoform X8 [Mizuhopecten yessoensis]|uniref:Transient receptor potential cation channel subfamily V member 6 n=1 Tax=Mizuhopecten yessoensis TaxID=6573 RepID=A0A210R561_MIZYE|nr:transient receptor potential cation channel subfamily V member 5-like isoform X8 [Mizuhopecten yessoensis]OWF56105.1 Transient receptor potential cation channel subfamily V member 6 [Mizuhopecten yessoensis]
MGNTTVVASNVKAQGDSDVKKLYQLVDLKGGGELIDLMKRARWRKNYKEIDEKIQTDVKKFLYNDGEGKKVPIVDLIMTRSKERSSNRPKINKNRQEKDKELAMIDMNFPDGQGNYLHNKPDGTSLPDRKFRETCWDLNERGTVGESILHLCLLNASAIHADLSKRLLQAYPKLILDIYTSEEYYGENVLHMAVVNEDPAMVKFLLDKGADVHARCCGRFMCPDDQKDSRSDSLDHEWVDVCETTNYDGHVYLGEYPLSFAACLGQEECVRLLVAKGANPNLQDNNGNTVMHMLVIHDKKEMFDLLRDLGAELDIKNRQGLTPLTLAAKLARKDMYEHILEKMREVCWIYGNVTCAGYPLRDIDTISSTGEINEKSALNLVVYGEVEGHLDMMDGVVVNLLKEKWKTFVRFRFYRRFAIFAVYFILFLVVFLLRPGDDMCPSRTVNMTGAENITTVEKDPCYLLKVCNTEDIVRFTLEALVLIGAIWYLLIAMKEIYHQGFRLFFTTLKGAPTKAMFLMSCVFVIMMLPGRAACAYIYEDVVGVMAILFTAPYFLFFCRGFPIFGPFVVMIYKMIKGDLFRFVIIYTVFIIGFSQAMYIVFRGIPDTPFSDPAEAVMGMFMMSLGEFGDYYESFDNTNYATLGKIVFFVYMIMVTLLLVNMLIAMMGNTYQLVNETQKEWFRQWAKILLVIEQSVTTEQRRIQQTKYSQPTKNDRALVIRWHQSEKEREELQKLREAQKMKQRKKILEERNRRILKKTPSNKTIVASDAKEGRVNI